MQRPQQRELFAAGLGFASAFSCLAGNRAQADVREIVTESERTASLAGRIGGDGEGTRVRVQLPAPATPPAVAAVPASQSELRH